MYKDNTFLYIYIVRTINPGQYPNPGKCDLSNIRLEMKLTVKLKIYSRKFKI